MGLLSGFRSICASAGALVCCGALAQGGDEFAYVVRDRDNLIGIGKRFLERPGDWTKLVRPNRIANPNLIRPGRTVRIPIELMRTEAAPAVVVQAVGDARASAVAARAGDSLREGSVLQTGSDGYVTVRLVDGSILTLQRQSALALEQLRKVSGTDLTVNRLRLDAGRVNAAVRSTRPGSSRFEVRGRQATAAVRGTEFRVGVLAERDAMAAEVLSGSVAFAGTAPAASAGVLVGAGYGSLVEGAQPARAPVPLLPAPDLASFAKLQERIVVRLRHPAVAQAGAYRAQVSRDAEFREVVREERTGAPDVRFVGLEDGDYHLRVRAIDVAGIEGRDATAAFRLKARPEPPLASAPAPRGKVRGTEARFEWTANPDAASYRIEIAEDAAFGRVVRSERALREPAYTLSGVAFGTYHWRLASTRGAADDGPWSDVQQFSLLPPPANPEPPAEEAGVLVLRWPSEPGQVFRVEFARDEKFVEAVKPLEVAEPVARIPRPSPGIYYVRVRATDPDGFVGPYTRPQRFEVKPLGGVFDGSGRPVTDSFGQPVGTR